MTNKLYEWVAKKIEINQMVNDAAEKKFRDYPGIGFDELSYKAYKECAEMILKEVNDFMELEHTPEAIKGEEETINYREELKAAVSELFKTQNELASLKSGQPKANGVEKDNLKWQTRDEIPMPTNPLQALRETFSFTSKDMGIEKQDAWVYGIIAGWDDAAYEELSVQHNWSNEQVNYNKTLHRNYNIAWNLFVSNPLQPNGVWPSEEEMETALEDHVGKWSKHATDQLSYKVGFNSCWRWLKSLQPLQQDNNQNKNV